MNFDFHIHTSYSYDSLLNPKKIAETVKKKCISGIAITDHNTINGALKLKSIANEDFIVIIGSEIRTDKGDVIGLFLNEEIKSREFTQVSDEIKDQGGIVILPHPYKSELALNNELLEMVDLIEGLNARISIEKNFKARKLAKESGIPYIGGSDAHTSYEIGQVQNVISENKMLIDIEDIRNYLLKGKIRIKGKESPNHLRILSRGIGKYKKEGMMNLLKISARKIIR